MKNTNIQKFADKILLEQVKESNKEKALKIQANLDKQADLNKGSHIPSVCNSCNWFPDYCGGHTGGCGNYFVEKKGGEVN